LHHTASEGIDAMLDDIKELLNKQPFEPFRLVTASGDKYEVLNRHNVALLNGRIFYAYPGGATWVFIRTQNITSIESVHKAA
jgi:hypothetical protein